jgi:hypothetical protein
MGLVSRVPLAQFGWHSMELSVPVPFAPLAAKVTAIANGRNISEG